MNVGDYIGPNRVVTCRPYVDPPLFRVYTLVESDNQLIFLVAVQWKEEEVVVGNRFYSLHLEAEEVSSLIFYEVSRTCSKQTLLESLEKDRNIGYSPPRTLIQRGERPSLGAYTYDLPFEPVYEMVNPLREELDQLKEEVSKLRGIVETLTGLDVYALERISRELQRRDL